MSANTNEKTATQTPRYMKNQGNMLPPEDNNNPLTAEFKGMKVCDLADKEFQIAVLRKFKEVQENRKII